MNSTESIPQVRDDDRDGQFFRLTSSVFSTSFCYGASVLLASYDTDDLVAADPVSASYDVEPAEAQTAASPSTVPVDHTAR
jgi:hypothetical protein